MKMPNRSRIHAIKPILIAAGLAAAATVSASATDALPGLTADSSNSAAGSVVVDPESAAQTKWRALMAQTATPDEGCFHASYPNNVWEKEDCKVAQPRVRPVHVKLTDNTEDVVGNTNDYVAAAKGLITLASGGFSTKGVKSEKSVGVAAFHDAGILGSNEYTLQLNTNAKETTSACAHHSGCTVWQQFVYSTDYIAPGEAAVFMQYWLLNWGSSACPSGWSKYDADCVTNSALKPVPDVPITDLGKLGLGATATAGGNDSVTFSYGTEAYGITGKDKVLDISSVWNKAEFNVLGDAGGSRADFNSGSSIAVTLVVLDGSTAAPTCVAHDGTTGETNNLNLGKCEAFSGIPNIQFTEYN
jgi:hypothetical protein